MSEEPVAVPPARYLELYRCLNCVGSIEAHRAGSRCDGWSGISPQFAWALQAALEILGDQWPVVPEGLGAPRIAERWFVDRRFLDRMRSSAHYLADEIAAGRAHERMPRCVADEVNLVIGMANARDIAAHESVLPIPVDLRDATMNGADGDYYEACDSLRQDADVELLFEPSLDGIEYETEILARLGLGPDDLRPEHWFEPYLHVEGSLFPGELG